MICLGNIIKKKSIYRQLEKEAAKGGTLNLNAQDLTSFIGLFILINIQKIVDN